MNGDKRNEVALVSQAAADVPLDALAPGIGPSDQPCAQHPGLPVDATPSPGLIETISSHNAATLLLNRALFDYAAERADLR